jgi:hypothetical protein
VEQRVSLSQSAGPGQRSDADVVEPGHFGFGGHGTLDVEKATTALLAQALTQLPDNDANAADMQMMITDE